MSVGGWVGVGVGVGVDVDVCVCIIGVMTTASRRAELRRKKKPKRVEKAAHTSPRHVYTHICRYLYSCMRVDIHI